MTDLDLNAISKRAESVRWKSSVREIIESASDVPALVEAVRELQEELRAIITDPDFDERYVALRDERDALQAELEVLKATEDARIAERDETILGLEAQLETVRATMPTYHRPMNDSTGGYRGILGGFRRECTCGAKWVDETSGIPFVCPREVALDSDPLDALSRLLQEAAARALEEVADQVTEGGWLLKHAARIRKGAPYDRP